MALSLEDFNAIIEDTTLLFSDEEIASYPTAEQTQEYNTQHPHYSGKYIELWTLYFVIIEHLAGKKFSGTSEEEDILRKSMSKHGWTANDQHDAKYISLLFTIISNKITNIMNCNQAMAFNTEWEMLLNYTSMYLPNQINNMFADKGKSKIFGRHNIANMPKLNRDMMEMMIKKNKI